jgi:hypothetical protein
MSLQEQVRELGYKLAVREIYGENTPEYFRMKNEHYRLLNKLYVREKRFF